MKRTLIIVITLVITLTMALPAAAAGGSNFPDVIPLPDNFNPEGITIGTRHTFYAGSLADGTILAGDLRTGKSQVLVTGQVGHMPWRL